MLRHCTLCTDEYLFIQTDEHLMYLAVTETNADEDKTKAKPNQKQKLIYDLLTIL